MEGILKLKILLLIIFFFPYGLITNAPVKYERDSPFHGGFGFKSCKVKFFDLIVFFS